jgi:type IV pilus assembly protein PilO
MNLEKLSISLKRIHFVRLALAILLINVIVWVFFVLPKRNRIETLQSNYASLRTQVAADQKEVRALEARVKKLQQAQKDLKTIYSDVLVPRREGVTAIRLELETLARDLQIIRQDFSYDYKDLPEFKLQHFTLGVPVEGNYRNIRRFINSIERSKHFLILDRVDLSSEKKTEAVNLDFVLSTYLVEDES